MRRLLVAFLLFLPLTLASCPANYDVSNLIADYVIFNTAPSASNPSQTFTFSFQTTFSIIPQVALGLQDFSMNYLDANSMAVYPSTVTRGQINFAWEYSLAVWSRVRLVFWASTNPQLQLGYFRVDAVQTQPSCNCAQAFTTISTPFGQSQNPVIRVFINGFDVASERLQISVSPSNLQGTKLTVTITVGSLTVLKRLWLSLLAFSPSSASFGSYGGQYSQSKYSGTVSSDISNTLYQTPYLFLGINLLSLSSKQPLSFSSAADSTFVLTVSASRVVDDFSLVYIAVGVAPSKHCLACGRNMVTCEGNCLSSCPVGSYAFTYRDGGVACRTCSSKLGLILSNGKCIQGSTTTTTTSTTITSNLPSSNQGSSSYNPVPITQPPTFPPEIPQQPPISSGNPSSLPPQPTPSPQALSPPVQTPIYGDDASSLPPAPCPSNAFYNGNECVCDVGYVWANGKCQAPVISAVYPAIILNPNKPDTKPSQNTHYSQSTQSSSSQSSSQSSQSSSSSYGPQPQLQQQPSSPFQSQLSQVDAPAHQDSSIPLPLSILPTPPTYQPPSANCGPNSYNNGLGICVCNQGSYFINNSCVIGTPCPLNSRRAPDGTCRCESGFTNYSGVCSKCPSGAFWSSSSNQCIFVCGQNSAYSSSAGSCVCNSGYGLFNNVCQACPDRYFISKGYCVTCPVNSAYNSATQNCDCITGFFTNQFGICARKCGTNQFYNSDSQTCSCLKGLGRVNGACQICPAGSNPTADGSSCSACGPNQEQVGSSCVCKQGFAFNTAGICTACSSLPNGFLVSGICAVCPNSMVYNGQSCACPFGKISHGALCISQCQGDELLDEKGNCYTCKSNQIISGGRCTCAPGYTMQSNDACTLTCSNNQFVFQNSACAACPLNTVYNSAIGGCACPSGYYMDSYSICQRLILTNVNCPQGQYFDGSSGCIPCSAACRTCKSANQCTTCASAGFSPNQQGVCMPICGDGLIVGNEGCDVGNRPSPGCLSCQVQNGYVCSGQPSVCRSTAPTPAPAPTPSPSPSAPTGSKALVQVGSTSINSNNVFISLQTSPTFTFSNPTEMQSFMQASFPSGPKPTVYCAQRNSPNLNTFDCLLIYPSGVPNSPFAVNFSYNHQGQSGATTVRVNPIVASNNRRIAQ